MPTVPNYVFDTDFVLKVRHVLRVVQSDIGREFVCNAKFGGQAWDMTGFTGSVVGVKPDGNAVEISATIDEDEFKFTLTEQMAAVAGNYEIFLTVVSGSNVKIQAPVLLCVLEGADGEISESAIGALTELLQTSQEALDDAQTALEDAQETLASIPADYSSLAATVATLDSNIGTTYDLVTTGTASPKAVLEQGGLADSAYHQPEARTTRVRSACPFHINGNDITIRWTGENIEAYIYQYGKDNNFIRFDGWKTDGYASFTPNANTEYLDLVFRKRVNGYDANLTPADVGTLSIIETSTNNMFACVTVSITFSYEPTTPPARGFQYHSPLPYSSYIGSGYEPVGNVTTSVGASNMYMVFPFLYQNVMYVNVYALSTNSVSNGYATCKFFFVKSALLNKYTLTNGE